AVGEIQDDEREHDQAQAPFQPAAVSAHPIEQCHCEGPRAPRDRVDGGAETCIIAWGRARPAADGEKLIGCTLASSPMSRPLILGLVFASGLAAQPTPGPRAAGPPSVL